MIVGSGRTLLRILRVLALAITVLFALIWTQRACLGYNREGVYFNEQQGVVYNEHAIWVYGLLAVIALGLFLLLTIVSSNR